VTSGAPVLVVDDDQNLRRGTERNLKARGYTVIKAEDTEGALTLVVLEGYPQLEELLPPKAA